MSRHTAHRLSHPRGVLALGPAPVTMGILNVTPDSFSDGGRFDRIESALAQARLMLAEGADILDIGGESTRPGHAEISARAELDRVLPVIEALRAEGVAAPISIDTYKAEVADAALAAGADIINDVYGLQRDPEIAAVAAARGAPAIVMHWDKARDPAHPLRDEMLRWFDTSLAIAADAGLGRDAIVLDPGFGFAKSLAENYRILADIAGHCTAGLPILAGTSRKSMLGRLLDVPPPERIEATVATSVLAYLGGAHIFRVHDVRANRDALRVARATLYGPPPELEPAP